VIVVVNKTGKKTAALIIEKLLWLAWYLGIVFGVLLIGGQLYLMIAGPQWLGETMKLQIETSGLVFSFTEGFNAPEAGTLFIFQFALVIPLLAIGLLIIFHLRKIFTTIAGGDPFSMQNSKRIRVIGWSVVAVSVLKALLSFFLGLYFSTLIDLPGLTLIANMRLEDFGGVFVGVIILILAEVFQHGARLQEESNLTV
jgi:hypothetical protein